MGSSSRSTTSQTGPWSPAAGPLAGQVPQIQDMGTTMAGWQPYGSYTGPAVAGFNTPQTTALSTIENTGNGGSTGAVNDANAMLKSTLDGTYLSAGNPYFGAMADRIKNSVLPALSSQWSSAGRFAGNEEAPRAISTGLSDAVGKLAYENYAQERGNQFSASGQAPTLDKAQYIDPSMAYGAGQAQQQLTQQQIEDAIYRATYLQQQPEQALSTTTGQLEGVGGMGSTGSSTTTASPSILSQILGGGMMAGGLFGRNGPFGGMGFSLPWMGSMGSAG